MTKFFLWPNYDPKHRIEDHEIVSAPSLPELRKKLITKYPGCDITIQIPTEYRSLRLKNLGVLYTGNRQGYWRSEGGKTLYPIDLRTGNIRRK